MLWSYVIGFSFSGKGLQVSVMVKVWIEIQIKNQLSDQLVLVEHLHDECHVDPLVELVRPKSPFFSWARRANIILEHHVMVASACN